MRPEKQKVATQASDKSHRRQKKKKEEDVSTAKEISADAEVAAVLKIRTRPRFLIIRRTKNTTVDSMFLLTGFSKNLVQHTMAQHRATMHSWSPEDQWEISR